MVDTSHSLSEQESSSPGKKSSFEEVFSLFPTSLWRGSWRGCWWRRLKAELARQPTRNEGHIGIHLPRLFFLWVCSMTFESMQAQLTSGSSEGPLSSIPNVSNQSFIKLIVIQPLVWASAMASFGNLFLVWFCPLELDKGLASGHPSLVIASIETKCSMM